MAQGSTVRTLLWAVLLPAALLAVVGPYFQTQMPLHQNHGFVDFLAFLASRPVVLGLSLYHYYAYASRFHDGAHIPVPPSPSHGLLGNATVHRDALHIPYLFADNENDLFFAQGYLHAQDRLWQMEVLRLVGWGRVSEALGPDTVPLDRLSRVLGFSQAARRDATRIPPADLPAMEAYAAGVTAFLRSGHPLPPEFVLTGHKPLGDEGGGRWTVADSCVVMRLLAFQMNRGWSHEVSQGILANAMDKAMKMEYDTRTNDTVPYINPRFEADFKPTQPRPAPQGAELWAQHAPPKPGKAEKLQAGAKVAPGGGKDKAWQKKIDIETAASGSNAWSVSGAHSASGKPLLAGDPHLQLTAPGFWYPLMMTNTKQYKEGKPNATGRAIGASAPGVPGFLLGHNGHVAVSMTLNYNDLEDLFVEVLSDDGLSYTHGGQQLPLQIRYERIRIKNAQQGGAKAGGAAREEDDSNGETLAVRSTHHGPLLSDVLDQVLDAVPSSNDTKIRAVSLASTAINAPLPARFLRMFLHATTYEEVANQVTEIRPLGLTATIATAGGDIGVLLTGEVPKRQGNGTLFMRDGTDPELNWQGSIPVADLPHVRNPAKGFTVSSNQRVAPDPDQLLGKTHMPGFRGERIEQMLQGAVDKKTKLDARALGKMQTDVKSLHGCEFTRLAYDLVLKHYAVNAIATDNWRDCVKAGVSDDLGEWSRKLMASWDCELSTDSVAATFYEVWRQFAVQKLFSQGGKMDKKTMEAAIGSGLHMIFNPKTEQSEHDKVTLLRALKRGVNSPLLNKSNGSVPLLCSSLNETYTYLSWRFGTDINKWRWGLVHAAHARHSFHPKPVLKEAFSIGPNEAAGDEDTVSQMFWSPTIVEAKSGETPWQSIKEVPSMRFVVDLGNLTDSIWMLPPGVSGWPGSPHYSDQLNALFKGDFYPMLWTDEQIQRAKKATLTLYPANGGGVRAEQRVA